MSGVTPEPTVNATLARVDEAWAAFWDRVHAVPSERLELRISEDAWTRKQMLAHISTWHELTSDRLARFHESGEPVDLGDETDAINARAARAAEGRTTGEIVVGMEDTYRRLRREIARLSDAQLAAHDAWASAIIAGNTFEHYDEHLADLEEANH